MRASDTTGIKDAALDSCIYNCYQRCGRSGHRTWSYQRLTRYGMRTCCTVPRRSGPGNTRTSLRGDIRYFVRQKRWSKNSRESQSADFTPTVDLRVRSYESLYRLHRLESGVFRRKVVWLLVNGT